MTFGSNKQFMINSFNSGVSLTSFSPGQECKAKTGADQGERGVETLIRLRKSGTGGITYHLGRRRKAQMVHVGLAERPGTLAAER